MTDLIDEYQNEVKRVICKKCGAVNGYAPHNVRTIDIGCDISNHSWTAQGINCDQCGAEVIIYAD